VAVLDLEDDGWPDLAVANDTTPNRLYRNRGDGSFEELGELAGIAWGDSGAARGAMGIDAGDVDGDGREDLLIGNFAKEMAALYRQEAGLRFVDRAAPAGLALPTLFSLTFGCLLVDVDLDGSRDVLLANGHIEPEVDRLMPPLRYAQPLLLFRNRGAGRFAGVEGAAAGALNTPSVARGLAAGDIDDDGDLDLLVSANGGPARLLRNELGAPERALVVRLEGTRTNRSAIGARVEASVGGRTLRARVRSGSSYGSASSLAIHLGLGDRRQADRITVDWPSGQRQEFHHVQGGRLYRLAESAPLEELSRLTRYTD
jgi:hypothetical protein